MKKILFVDLTTKLECLSDLNRKGRGGMITSLVILPNILSRMGYHCVVMAGINQSETTSDNVMWLGWDDHYKAISQKWDYLVLNRQTYGDCLPEIKAYSRILWVHDIVHSGWIANPDKIDDINMTVFMSEYSQKTWTTYYPHLKTNIIIPNGVDKSLFYPDFDNKDKNLLLYFSAPNRGLTYLPIIFEIVTQKTGLPLKLVAFSDMQILHPNENNSNYQRTYETCRKSGIDLREPIPQPMLAEWVRGARVCLKPSNYAETCSNVTLQCLAAGTPLVCLNVGADQEWIENDINGKVVPFSELDGPVFILDFCRKLIDLLIDEDNYYKLCIGTARTSVLTWDGVGREWDKMLKKIA